jgi:diadenosine tetraphosphate (Ap4A) HIT family hydrolase
MAPTDCPLCQTQHSNPLYGTARWRIVDANERLFPGFTRVIWQAHCKEMTDLSDAHRHELMQVVFEVESVMRAVLKPDKINLASLGNQAPHLHWHVIPRWQHDASFPQSVWSPTTREPQTMSNLDTEVRGRLSDYHQRLVQHLSGLFT